LAIQEIRKRFSAGRAARAVDAAGRLIAADEQLLALHLMKPGDGRPPAGGAASGGAAERLRRRGDAIGATACS